MKPLGLGALGVGEGRSSISAVVLRPVCDVVALGDLNARLGHKRCEGFKLPAALFTPPLDALLANPAVDVVGVYTPDHLHAGHVIRFEDQDAHYFRFEGHSHHAGEYQNYIENFSRCIAAGTEPNPDVTEGIVTVALMQAMEQSCDEDRPGKLGEVLGRHALSELSA